MPHASPTSPSPRVALLALSLLMGAVTACAPSSARQDRAPDDVDVFARVPAQPGTPEGIAVSPDGTVDVASNAGGNGPNGPQFGQPSRIFSYGPSGQLRREYVIAGQDLTAAEKPAYGLQALAFDGSGVLYAVDKVPARIIRLDPRTGQQSDYARFPDLPPCAPGATAPCSDTASDRRPFPNYLAFAPNGSLYVSDFQQALVWRVPPGGGAPEVAFTNRQLDSEMGPNGVGLTRDGRTLVLAVTMNPQGVGTAGAGRLYTLRVGADGRLNTLRVLYESGPGEGPDGFALSASGHIYLNLTEARQVAVISPAGREVRRVGEKGSGANGTSIPFDGNASAAFVGDRLLITNQAVSTRNPNSFAVLDLFAGEPGLPLFRPVIGQGGP